MEVIARLEKEKNELVERVKGQWQGGGSQKKEILQYKIRKINQLIAAYQTVSSPTDLSAAARILNQQVGLAEQKKLLLEKLEIAEFQRQQELKREPQTWCLVGPPGTGKTTFARNFAHAAGKQFFRLTLGGLSEASFLLGTSESSGGNEIGKLAQALVETATSDPVIVLEEIDKTGWPFKTALLDCLTAVLDPTQNQEILDHYLNVKLDFSRVTFLVTINDPKKIPSYLRSRLLIIELPGYSREQKRAIAHQIVHQKFSSWENNYEVTPEALETLINKTREKGVRQLERSLNIIFDHGCLLTWAREMKQGKEKSKIVINSDLVNQTLPSTFLSVDEEESENLVPTFSTLGKDNWSIAGNPWFVLFLVSLLLAGILGWKNYLLEQKRQSEKR